MCYKKINSYEEKRIILNILINFDCFCRDNNLKYYLSGGTLLGAIRHKGFIPWDDDIDVCMPRKDYEQLIKIFPKIYRNKFILKCIEYKNFKYPFIKIVNINTKIINKYVNNEMENNLWIDILPVDGLPQNNNDLKRIYKSVKFYRKLLMLNFANIGEGKTLLKQVFKPLFILFAKFIGVNRCITEIEKIAKAYDYDKSDYVGAITWGLYGVGERMKKSEFEKTVYVDFEGYKFPTFSCWDSYLKALYGDYMKLPPVEKRKTHDMEAYYIGDENK